VSPQQARFDDNFKSRGYGTDHLLYGRSFVRVGFESYYPTLEVPIRHNLILNLELNLDLACHRYQPRDSHLKGSPIPRPPPSSRTQFWDPIPVRYPSSSSSSRSLSYQDRYCLNLSSHPAMLPILSAPPARPLVSHLTLINLIRLVPVRSSFSGFGNGYNMFQSTRLLEP
jgi:hypothetical protein